MLFTFYHVAPFIMGMLQNRKWSLCFIKVTTVGVVSIVFKQMLQS